VDRYVTPVLHYVDDHAGDLLDFACELIASPSVNPPGDERAAVYAVTRRLDALGLGGAQIKAKTPERPNVLCRLPGDAGGPTLMLSGHLDTKPVGDRSQWRTDPLHGEVIDGRLYGLGVGDMKGAVAAMVYAAAALRAAGVPLAGDLLLVFSADEEAGSACGAGYLVESGLVQADAAVLGEPAGVRCEWEGIYLISRGITCFRTRVWGTQMHSSVAGLLPAVNASAKMAHTLWRMDRDLQPRIQCPRHPWSTQGPKVNVGVMVGGGVYWGVYPGYAEFGTDLRTMPGMTQAGVRADVEAFLDELRQEDPDLQVDLKFEPSPLGWIEPSEIAADHPVVVALQQAAARVFGSSPPLSAYPATTDAPRFQLGAGIPTVAAFGPGRLPLAHSPNEHIAVESLVQAAHVYALCAMNYLGDGISSHN
jgi:acetylornithine deacetylase/succinyl-diaminopimelate desuccinylase-like protein